MKTILMVAFAVLSLAAFTFAVLSLAAYTPSDNDIPNVNSNKICLDGVLYHKIRDQGKTLGVAVAYNTDGTIKLCEVE